MCYNRSEVILMKYEKGKIVKGCVTGIESYGIFVNFDEYYTGLVHISEVSNGFVRNINNYVSLGETINVKILDVDEQNFHLKLSIKDIKYKASIRKRKKIEETGSGFDILKNNLDGWISKKLNEMN